MTALLTASCRSDVSNALADAIMRHTLIACHIATDPALVSWVSYRTEFGKVVRLTFYPPDPSCWEMDVAE